MSPEIKHHSRRSFLQSSAIIAGLNILPKELPASIAPQVVANGIQDATGWEGATPSDSPEVSTHQVEASTLPDALDGAEASTGPTLGQSFNVVVIAPVIEEAGFRALPSFVLTKLSGHHEQHEEKFAGLSKTELTTGLVTSTIFAASHLPRNRSRAKNRLPAAQFVSGMYFWRLQRQTGYQANVAAHSGHNAVLVAAVKAASLIKRS